MWQDYVIGIGAFFFILTLIPSITSKNKPDIKTSVPTAIILYVFSLSYVTLGLWLAASTTFGTALGWSILSWQKYKIDKVPKSEKSGGK